MARDYKRLTRRARHLIRRLRRTKHAAVQRVTVHELSNEIHRRRFGRAARTASPDLGKAGQWRPLSYRAKKLLTQLRKTKVWSVQRRLVKELGEEIERSRLTLAARARKARQQWRKRGRRFRKTVQRGQERLLARAERKQAARQAGARKPPLHARAARNLRGRVKSWRGISPSRSRRNARRHPGNQPHPGRPRTERTPRAPSAPRTVRTPRAPARTR